jgi:hypothetical protein
VRARVVLLALGLAVAAGAWPAARAARPASAFDHLRAIVGLSQPPEYRRAGSPGMAAVGDYAAAKLAAAGYAVVGQPFAFRRWTIDYAPGREPLLERIGDGVRFKTESAFNLDRVTGPEGVVCRVRPVADVRPGDCGFVPFGSASPEWKNQPFVSVSSALERIEAAGGAGAIVQGDVTNDLVFAQSVRRALPTVVAVAHADELIGRRVRLRAIGAYDDAGAGRNVIGVLRPPRGVTDYVLLLAHADGWFQAASDNGSGAAAVLRAAEVLASAGPGIGVIAALVDAEEVGLIGSERLAEAFDAGLPIPDGGKPIRTRNIKAVINLDASSARASDVQGAVRGLARRDAPVFQWRAMIFSEEPALTAAFLGRFAARGVLGLPIPASVFRPVGAGSLDGRLRTDAHHFTVRDIPIVWPVSGYPEYHTDGDTLGAVNRADLEAIAAATADLVADIAGLPLRRVPAPFRPPTQFRVTDPEWLERFEGHLGHDH